jgi:hypothetical protein
MPSASWTRTRTPQAMGGWPPFVRNTPPGALVMADHHGHVVSGAAPAWIPLAAVTIHSLAYLAMTTMVTWFVHRKVGLALLRKAWWNVDLM